MLLGSQVKHKEMTGSAKEFPAPMAAKKPDHLPPQARGWGAGQLDSEPDGLLYLQTEQTDRPAG